MVQRVLYGVNRREGKEDKNEKLLLQEPDMLALSIATLLSQHHEVTAVDIIPEKVELINHKKSPDSG